MDYYGDDQPPFPSSVGPDMNGCSSSMADTNLKPKILLMIDLFDPTFDAEAIFSNCGSLVFIIDSQDDTVDAEQKLVDTVIKAFEVNPKIVFEVFIHKVDGLSDDHKIDLHRNLQQRVTEELNVQVHRTHQVPRFVIDTLHSGEAVVVTVHVENRSPTPSSRNKHTNTHLSFHQTSIYDHSVFEAFSKVIQKLIPQLPTLENLLDMFISNSRIEKAFLFDVLSKIYIATDSSPVDNQTYELCSDMIDVVIDVSSIYGVKRDGAADPSPDPGSLVTHHDDDGEGSAMNSSVFPYDQQSSSVIKLNNGMVLYLRQVNRYLALVCLMRDENFNKFGLINYNFETFKLAIKEVFEVRKIRGGHPE